MQKRIALYTLFVVSLLTPKIHAILPASVLLSSKAAGIIVIVFGNETYKKVLQYAVAKKAAEEQNQKQNK